MCSLFIKQDWKQVAAVAGEANVERKTSRLGGKGVNFGERIAYMG